MLFSAGAAAGLPARLATMAPAATLPCALADEPDLGMAPAGEAGSLGDRAGALRRDDVDDIGNLVAEATLHRHRGCIDAIDPASVLAGDPGDHAREFRFPRC